MNLPYRFTAGTKAKADEVNANFTTVANAIDEINESLINNSTSLQAIIETQITNLENSLRPIGQPIYRLNNALYDDEIRLEGAEVSKTDYPNLFAIYGTTYGTAANSNNFKLPDFRNRAVYGASNFGYLSAGLPNITGNIGAVNAAYGGAFYRNGTGTITLSTRNGSNWGSYGIFDASKSNAIYGKSSTVQPPAIKVRVVTRYQ